MFSVPAMTGAECAKPEYLPLVDAAYEKPGGPEAKEIKRKLCPICPVAAACLGEAMARGEWGVWGGTSPKMRTSHGGTKARAKPRVA